MGRKLVHIYPTLRCNGKCAYCSNTFPGMKGIHSYQERMPGHWIKLLYKIGADWEIYFTGGEVFLFQGFNTILESIPSKLAKVYTNGMLLDDLMVKAVNPALMLFRLSYHPGIGPVGRFLEGVETLKKKEIPFQIYMVNASIQVLSLKVNDFRKAGYEVGIDYDQRNHVHKKGRVKCFIPSVFIGPDGTVFNCVSRMLRNCGGMGNVHEGFELKEASPVICEEPGLCSPCDLAAAYQEVL
jgi:hypothetical protein